VRSDGELRIGPDSVGYELTTKALIFGGEILTATDIAVAAGRAEIGDARAVRGLKRQVIEGALALIEESISQAVDRMKTSADPIPLVVVGGGSILLGDRLAGASELVKPNHFAVANAIGAAIAQVGGEVDRIFALDQMGRETALEQAKQEAIEKAVAAGAREETVNIVDVEEVPLAYLPSNAARIRVKAIGELALEAESVA